MVVLHDLRARTLQQASVRYSRGASGLTIQAAEAAVNVGDERFAQRQPSLVHLHHLIDAAPRRIHLRAQSAIGRTLVEAQPAVNTLGVKVPRRLLSRQEVGDWLFRNWRCCAQKRNLPRFRMSCGSSASFTARMLSKSVRIGPHAGTWWRASDWAVKNGHADIARQTISQPRGRINEIDDALLPHAAPATWQSANGQLLPCQLPQA